ncbi:MAG TPA: deaminase [Candidatus Magasanikbacteria bacterium]|nr:deaminase [Candidatus Magasanikbacteria bacterium]
MKYLSGQEEKQALEYINKATRIALDSTCERAKCGCVIVKDGKVIGQGFNSPPLNTEKQRRCLFDKNTYNPKVTDKTCCIHAEQRAIMDALRNNPDKLIGSTLYFIRLDEDKTPARAGKPYCTICSKMALDVGIVEFVLWHDQGICVYNTDEYNTLSYQYQE